MIGVFAKCKRVVPQHQHSGPSRNTTWSGMLKKEKEARTFL